VLVTLDLAPSPASVGEARRFTVATLRRWGRDDLTTSAALLVSELVTNAILHARTMIQLCLVHRDEVVRVEVRDGSSIRPAVRDHGLDATTGRGLALVSLLAASWGVDLVASGKVVWAQLAEEADEQSPDQFSVVSDDDNDEPRGGGADAAPRDMRDPRGEPPTDLVPALGLCA
jgi:anti-sigma regulatory factor (Ser/Thr protein kinase)